MADEPDRQRSQYPPPDDPNRAYYPPASREGTAREDKNSYPVPEDPTRAGHYPQGSPATGPPRDDRMAYPPPDPSRQPPYSYDPRTGQYQPPPHQWNGQYPAPQYPVSSAARGAVLLNLLTSVRILPIPAINILRPREATASTISLLPMPIVYRRHFRVLAIHIHPPTTIPPLKRRHHVSEPPSRASTVARERLVQEIADVWCSPADAVALDSLLGL
jgi:hypothetical protein